jgi:hypothetical protein
MPRVPTGAIPAAASAHARGTPRVPTGAIPAGWHSSLVPTRAIPAGWNGSLVPTRAIPAAWIAPRSRRGDDPACRRPTPRWNALPTNGRDCRRLAQQRCSSRSDSRRVEPQPRSTWSDSRHMEPLPLHWRRPPDTAFRHQAPASRTHEPGTGRVTVRLRQGDDRPMGDPGSRLYSVPRGIAMRRRRSRRNGASRTRGVVRKTTRRSRTASTVRHQRFLRS